MDPCIACESLDRLGIEYKKEYDLSGASTFRIGGRCLLAVFPKSVFQLTFAISTLDYESIPFCILGRGSNTLIFDGYVEKAIIFTSGLDKATVRGDTVISDAGVSLAKLSSLAANAGLSGLEFASGIPGSVGGALFMNAGAHGAAMADVVVSSLAYDRESREVLHITDHGFGYRKSVYMENKNLVCLGATLRLTVGNSDDIKHKIKELLAQRREKQPLEFASAGSYFKRPEGDFAGRLIELCGLKGFAVGDAQVSQKHAGFVINRGGATFDDVMRLEEHIVKTVYEQTGVTLQREVEIIR